MDLLPKTIFTIVRPLFQRRGVARWRLNQAEKHTRLFSTAIPITGLMAIMVGTGIIICDKQREVAYYRYRSAGTRTQRLEEEHDKLVQFMNETKPLAPEEIVYKPIPKERDTVV